LIARFLPKEWALVFYLRQEQIWPKKWRISGRLRILGWSICAALFRELFFDRMLGEKSSNFIDGRGKGQILGGTTRISEAVAGLAAVALALLRFDTIGPDLTTVTVAVSLSESLMFLR
jgi:hypothetical protein